MKLFFEQLERRDLLTVLRIASWNTANNPDNAAEDADFRTVLEAIGVESVQGNSARISLLALQETDVPGSGLDSIGRIETILETAYPGTDYASAVSSLDGGGDATGFVFDTSALSLLGTEQFAAGLTHTTLRGNFRPSGTAGDADFLVYSTHLKAGTTGGDKSTRASEASLLRTDADLLGVGAQVIMAGDFNIQSSSEPAYVNFVAAGPGQLEDPIDTPGNWNNNNAFRSVHTQNPGDPTLGGGGMDDRFDFQLLTGEFFDGFGIDYIDGSYRAFGNNGTHSINQSITRGTGADPGVLAALAVASDHLPVVADYEVLSTTAGITITESSGTTLVAEGGNIDGYSVALTSVPQSDVTVTVTPDLQTDVGAGPGESMSLVFTPGNALTAQTVVVTANDDGLAEGTHSSTIVHASLSDDLAFDRLAIADVTATVLDDEAPTIVINEVDADTESIDMLEFVELYDGGLRNASLTGLTVVFYNGATDESYAAFDLDGFTTDDDGFFLLGNSAINPAVTFNNNFLQNGADAVALYAADATDFPSGTPLTTTDLLDALVYDTDDADDAGLLSLLLPAQPQVNEDENNNKVVESSSRIPDGGATRATTSYVVQAVTPGTFNQPPTTGVVVAQSGGRTDVEEGGLTDSYTLALTTFPSSDATITITPDAQLDLGNGPGSPIQLNFSPSNAVIPQTVTVTAVNDLAIEGLHAGIITHAIASSDIDYDGIPIGDLVSNITDNEVAPQTNVVISELMYNPDSDEAEPGVAEWIEVINKGNVPVSLDGWTFDDEDATDWGAIPAGTTLEIGQVAVFFDEDFASESLFRASWSVPPTALVIGIPWGSLANGPSSGNEILQLLANGSVVQDQVNYDDSGDWPSDSPDGPSIYLTDVLADNDRGVNWARSRVGTDNAIKPTAPFSTADIESPGFVDCPVEVVVTEVGGGTAVTEGGSDDFIDVALVGVPGSDVLVTLTPTDADIDLGEGPGVAVTLTFTPASAQLPQIVTVTGVDDEDVEGAHTSSITFQVTSNDPSFDGFDLPDVTVSITDNDSPPAGDFDDDNDYDCADVDALVAQIVSGTMDLGFDLTGDDLVDQADLTAWLMEAGEQNLEPGRAYLGGDANLDGSVNRDDFIVWNNNKFTMAAAWCRADFNADGNVDGADLLIWNANKSNDPAVLVADDDGVSRENRSLQMRLESREGRAAAEFSSVLGTPNAAEHHDLTNGYATRRRASQSDDPTAAADLLMASASDDVISPSDFTGQLTSGRFAQ